MSKKTFKKAIGAFIEKANRNQRRWNLPLKKKKKD
jgi:predicted RNA-binding protein (virulence factor B family)